MIFIHKFRVQQSVDEVVETLVDSIPPLISALPSVRQGVSLEKVHGIGEVHFFRGDAPTNDEPDDNGENCWYYRRDGVIVEGRVIYVVMRPMLEGAQCAFVCNDDEYLPEFKRLLRLFGQELPEVRDDTPQTEWYKRLDRMVR